jgi:hypothetical protein
MSTNIERSVLHRREPMRRELQSAPLVPPGPSEVPAASHATLAVAGPTPMGFRARRKWRRWKGTSSWCTGADRRR